MMSYIIRDIAGPSLILSLSHDSSTAGSIFKEALFLGDKVKGGG